ncbi:MAG: hypothetical protein ABI140_09480 [Jatrophihabitantaceae bacterium]
MSLRSARTFRVAAGMLAVAALAISSPAAAATMSKARHDDGHGSEHGHGANIPITITTADGFTAPRSVHAGWVTFTVSTPETSYHALQVLRLKGGSTLSQVLTDFTLGLSDSRADNAQGARDLYRDATLMGGVVTSAYAAQSVSMPMTPGTYYLLDQNEIGGPTPVRVHTLKVNGHMDWDGMPRFSATIGMVIDNMDMPAFVAPSDLKADGNILMYGQGDELHEAVFRPIKPGITDDYITQYYKDLDAGLPHAPSPWTDIQHGLQAMSPGQFVVFHLNLPPGLYALVCLVPDDVSGIAHSHMGMHKVITLH